MLSLLCAMPCGVCPLSPHNALWCLSSLSSQCPVGFVFSLLTMPCGILVLQTALQLLEKSVHEKQDTVVTLRKQLEEIKAANLKMQAQLKVREA